MSNFNLTFLDVRPLSRLDRIYGAFRVLDSNGVIFEEYDMNEGQATDLACWLGGSIEHQDPDTGIWHNW